jgi:triosephosphate isomerase
MTNKYLYFVANWKMYGDLTTLNSLDKVIKFSKTIKQKRFKLIYCPPNTLIRPLSKRLKKTKIEVGANFIFYNIDKEYSKSSSLVLSSFKFGLLLYSLSIL